MTIRRSILLVPDRYERKETLFLGDACGLHMPVVYSGGSCAYPTHRAWQELPNKDCYMCQYPDRALVLVWKGEVLNEGCDRATRALNAVRKKQGLRPKLWLFDSYTEEDALILAQQCAGEKVGVVKIVDLEQEEA